MPLEAPLTCQDAHLAKAPRRGTEELAAAVLRTSLFHSDAEGRRDLPYLVVSEILRLALMADKDGGDTERLIATALNLPEPEDAADGMALLRTYDAVIKHFASKWSAAVLDTHNVLEDCAVHEVSNRGDNATTLDGDRLKRLAWASIADRYLGGDDPVGTLILRSENMFLTIYDASSLGSFTRNGAAGATIVDARRTMPGCDIRMAQTRPETGILYSRLDQAVVLGERSSLDMVTSWPSVEDVLEAIRSVEPRELLSAPMMARVTGSFEALINFAGAVGSRDRGVASREVRRETLPFTLSFIARQWEFRYAVKPLPAKSALVWMLEKTMLEGLRDLGNDTPQEFRGGEAWDIAVRDVGSLLAIDVPGVSFLNRVDELIDSLKREPDRASKVTTLMAYILREAPSAHSYGSAVQAALALPENGGLGAWYADKPASESLDRYLHRSIAFSGPVWTAASDMDHWRWMTGFVSGTPRASKTDADRAYPRRPAYECCPHTCRSGTLRAEDLRVYAARTSVIGTTLTSSVDSDAANPVPARQRALALLAAEMSNDVAEARRRLLDGSISPTREWPATLGATDPPPRTGSTLLDVAGLLFYVAPPSAYGEDTAPVRLYRKLAAYTRSLATANARVFDATSRWAGWPSTQTTKPNIALALKLAGEFRAPSAFGLACLPDAPPMRKGSPTSLMATARAVLYAPHALLALWESAGAGPLDAHGVPTAVPAAAASEAGVIGGAAATITMCASREYTGEADNHRVSALLVSSDTHPPGEEAWVVTTAVDATIHLAYDPATMTAVSALDEQNIAATAAIIVAREKEALHREVVDQFWALLTTPDTPFTIASTNGFVRVSAIASISAAAGRRGKVRPLPISVLIGGEEDDDGDQAADGRAGSRALRLRPASTIDARENAAFFVGTNVRTLGEGRRQIQGALADPAVPAAPRLCYSGAPPDAADIPSVFSLMAISADDEEQPVAPGELFPPMAPLPASEYGDEEWSEEDDVLSYSSDGEYYDSSDYEDYSYRSGSERTPYDSPEYGIPAIYESESESE